jgi:hypothetical protein
VLEMKTVLCKLQIIIVLQHGIRVEKFRADSEGHLEFHTCRTNVLHLK